MANTNPSSIQTPVFHLVVQEHPVAEPTVHNVPVGVRVSEILKHAAKGKKFAPQLLVNGESVHGNYKPRPNDVVNVTYVPQGELAWYWVVAIVVGSAALSYMLMPEIGVDQNGSDENKFERISGLKNKQPLYKPYQAVLGKRKVAPVYVARPFTKAVGDREYFYALLSAGYGPLKLENFRIGETAVEDFDDVSIVVLDHYENTDESAIRNFWKSDITQESVQIELRVEEGWTNRTTAANPSEISSTFSLPSGLYKTDNKGNTKPQSVSVRQDIQDANGDWWTVVLKQNPNNGIIAPDRGRFTKFDGDTYRWEVDSKDGYFGPLDTNFATSNAELLSNLGNFETIDSGIYLFIKNLPESELATSYVIKGDSRKPRLSVFTVPIPEEILPSGGVLNVRTRKEYPSQQEVEESRGAANIMWENLQTIRPLTEQGFREGIGYNRPLLRYDGTTVRTFRPTLIGIKMRATGQLNGNLDNFYVDATMCVPKDKDADWRNWPDMELEPSNNPADAYKWLMQGPMNYSPIPNDKIDNLNLQTWRARCVAENWTISQLVDYESTLLKELQNIAYLGRASFRFREGKFGVVEKIERTVPRQIFTPKNSANFQSKRVYPEVVDGIKFQFESALLDYERDEGIFLDPAKEADPDKLRGRYTTNELWGVDNFDQAYRLTRFDYYEKFLQREAYTLDVDAEVLASDRGDMVRIQNDVISVGLGAGRVKAINGSIVTLDEQVNTDVLPANVGLQFRDSLGIITSTAANYLGDGRWDCANLDANVKVGDLAVYGELGKEAIDCIITSINYNDELGATLSLLNAANEVYAYDGNPIPEYNPSITKVVDILPPDPPIISATAGRGSLDVTVSVPKGVSYTSYTTAIQVRQYPLGRTPTNFFETEEEGWSYVAQGDGGQSTFSINSLTRGVNYEVRAQFRGASNTVSAWSNKVSVELPLSDVPLIIQDISFTHALDGTYLIYTEVTDIDFSGYEIRKDANFGSQTNLVGFTKDNSFFVGLLTEDTEYYVAATNNYGEYGTPVSVLVTKHTPSNISALSSSVEGLTVRLTWARGASGYAIDYFEVRYNDWDSQDRTLAGSEELGSTDGMTFLHGVGFAGTYTYYVRAVDIAGNVSDYVSVEQVVEVGAETIKEELEGIDTHIGEISTELLGINTELDGINQSIQNITVDLGDLGSDITAINTEVGNLTTSIGEINDELDLVNSSLFTIDSNLDDLEYRVTYNANQGEDLELLALDSIVQQSASREDLRARLERDEQLIGAVVYVDPATGTIVNRAYQYTDASFTQAAVLIDGVDAKVTLLAEEVGVIEGEVNNLSSELSLIPGQITATANAVVAEAISALEPAHTFNFFDSAQGWTAVNGTLDDTIPNQIQVTWGDIQNTALNFSAEDNTSIRITIERTGGTGWVGDLYLERDDTSTETFVGIIEDIPAGGEIIRIIDMRGVDGWDGNITKLRLSLGASAADTFVIKQIVIGKPDANLLQLEDITARITQAELDINAVEGELAQRVTTSYYNNNTVTYGNVEQVLSASPTIASIENNVSLVEGDVSAVVARVDQVELDVNGATTAITVLEGQVNNPTAHNSALYNFIQTAQSTADGNTQSITNLTNRIDTAEGDILANAGLIQGVRADVDDNITAISALEGLVNDPITGLSATYTLAGEAKSTADGNSTALTNLNTRVTDAESNIAANASLIQQVELDVSGNTSSITSLANRVTDAEGDIAANTSLLQAARQDIDGNITAISALEGSVNDPVTGLAITYTNASNALALANNNASSITTLGNRITDAEGDIIANAGLIQGVRTDVDNNTAAITLLQGSVNDPDTGLSAAYQLANTAKVTADNNASSINVLEGTVNDPVSGLSATNQIAQQAFTTADGNAQAITELDARVTTTEGFAEAQLILNSQYDEELGELNSSITNRTFQIVGNYEDFEDSQLQQLDALVSVAEARAGQLDRNLSFADAISRIEVTVGENGSIAKAITQLEAVTNTQAGLIEATANSVQQVRTDLDGAADSITVLQGQVNDPLTGLSATNTLAQQAKSTADGNVTAISQLDARVTDNEDFAAAQLQLNAGYDSDLDELFARVFLGTDANNTITGIVIDGVTQQVEFQSNSVVFLDGNSQPKIYFDNVNGRYVFDGHIVAQTGTFSGTVSGGDINIGGGNFTVSSSGNLFANNAILNGNIKIIGGTFQSISTSHMIVKSGTPFGPDNLIEWFGPVAGNVSNGEAILSNLSRANATTWKAYNGEYSRDIVTRRAIGARVTTVTHPSQGNQILVDGRGTATYVSSFTITGLPPPYYTVTMTILLKRGATTIASKTVSTPTVPAYEHQGGSSYFVMVDANISADIAAAATIGYTTQDFTVEISSVTVDTPPSSASRVYDTSITTTEIRP